MEDKQIVDLYYQRSESAIAETDRKYGRYCFSIARNILTQREDAQECVNDTYLAAWNAIPPTRPGVLSAFLGKLIRRISIDRWRYLNAQKRGGGMVSLALEELSECIPGGADPEAQLEAQELAKAVNRFLETLSALERKVFLLRYFELAGMKQLESSCRISEAKAKSMLHRLRKKLRSHLQKEGY